MLNYHNITGEDDRTRFKKIYDGLKAAKRDYNFTIKDPSIYRDIKRWEVQLFLNGLNVVTFDPRDIRVYDSEIIKKASNN